MRPIRVAILALALSACATLQPVDRDPGGAPIYLMDVETRVRWTPEVQRMTAEIVGGYNGCRQWLTDYRIPLDGWSLLRTEVRTEGDTRPYNAAVAGLTIDVRWPPGYGEAYIGNAICHEVWHALVARDHNHALMQAAGYKW